MMVLFSEEYIQKAYGKEQFDQGKAEGKTEGIISTLVSLVKQGLLSLQDASKQAKLNEEEFAVLLSETSV